MPKVFSVGDLNVDIFLHYAPSPVPGTEAQVPEISYSLGGNAANYATALSRLGMETRLIAALGKDPFSDFLTEELQKSRAHFIPIPSRSQNGVSAIFISPGGERAILSNKGASLEMDSEKAALKVLPELGKGDLVFFGGFFHLPRMRKGFRKLLQQIKAKGGITLFDATYDTSGQWEVASFMDQVDYFFLDRVETEKITGCTGTKKAVDWLLENNASCVILKRDKEGALFCSPSLSCSDPAPDVKPLNATGAGDSFNAGFTYGLLKGLSPKQCLQCGNFVAGQRISHEGYFLPSGEMLEAYLKKQ